MPTVFEGTLDLPDVIRGADLLLVGRFAEVVDEEGDLLEGEAERMIATARFRVEEVIKGALDSDSVDVRLVPELAELFIDKAPDKRVILALSSDSAPKHCGQRFVPYFSTVLPLDHDDRIAGASRRQEIRHLPGSLDEVRGLAAEVEKETGRDVPLGYEAGEDEIGDEEVRDAEVAEMPPADLRDASRGESDDLEQAKATGSQFVAPIGETPRD
jgi:hypothetical protein